MKVESSPKKLTDRHRAYLEFIREHMATHARKPPSVARLRTVFADTGPVVRRVIATLARKRLIHPATARKIGLPRGVVHVDDNDGSPHRPPDEIDDALDPEIGALVEALRADCRVMTHSSCWGHGKQPAFIGLGVDGIEGLRHFLRRLNRVARDLEEHAWFEVTLNWDERVTTACAFDLFPSWIMLSWTIEGCGPRRPPSQRVLARIADSYRRAGVAE